MFLVLVPLLLVVLLVVLPLFVGVDETDLFDALAPAAAGASPVSPLREDFPICQDWAATALGSLVRYSVGQLWRTNRHCSELLC